MFSVATMSGGAAALDCQGASLGCADIGRLSSKIEHERLGAGGLNVRGSLVKVLKVPRYKDNA
jgi:hypothetical protein